MVKKYTIKIHKGYLKLTFIDKKWLTYLDGDEDEDILFCDKDDIVFCKFHLNNEIIFHRPNGPALMLNNGHQEWWLGGKQNNKDGPLLKNSSGYLAYKVNNFYSPEESFWNH